MYYGSRSVEILEGGLEWVPSVEFDRPYREGEIVVRKDGYPYAKDYIGVLLWRGPEDSHGDSAGDRGGGQGGRNGRVETAIMRWDLVPGTTSGGRIRPWRRPCGRKRHGRRTRPLAARRDSPPTMPASRLWRACPATGTRGRRGCAWSRRRRPSRSGPIWKSRPGSSRGGNTR